MDSLDMLANNIANTGTAGYKTDREFYGLYQDQIPVVENAWTDFSQGSLTQTGNPLNLALSGPGLFALNGPNGTIYTRNGDFQISKANQLATPEGYTLRNVLDQGKPMVVDPLQPISISKNGVVSQGGQDLGQIEIDSAAGAAQSLAKLGNSYFSMTEGASALQPSPATEALQGQIEQSNVPVGEAAVKLIGVMRQFEMLQKAMTIGADMSKHGMEDVAKVV